MNASTRLTCFVTLTKRILIYSDTTTIRVMLALGSIGWVVGLWLPLHTFERSGFLWMRAAMPEFAWGLLFLVHGVGVLWRIYEGRRRPHWAVAINALGFMLWTSSTLLLTMAVGEYTPGAALEWVLCAASAVALVRTGLNDEVVTV